MRLYETTFVLNPQADETALDNQVKAVGKLITDNGGKIVAEDRMGNRRLAYEIAGSMQGYFTSFMFEAQAGVLPLLERHYKLEEPYIRHLTILFEGDPEVVKERQQAMVTSMEANERARRAAREERASRHGSDRHGSDHRKPREYNAPRRSERPDSTAGDSSGSDVKERAAGDSSSSDVKERAAGDSSGSDVKERAAGDSSGSDVKEKAASTLPTPKEKPSEDKKPHAPQEETEL